MADEKKPLPVYTIKPEPSGYVLYRQDKPLETPRNLPVTAPNEKLAQALVEECRTQGEKLDLRKMPMMQMILTALDITAVQRNDIVNGILRYGDSELLCQRAEEPAELVDEQNKVWQPYLDWAREVLHADLRTGSGIIPFEQTPEALEKLRAHVETFDAFVLTGVSEAVGISGSLVLGLALTAGFADPAAITEAAELEQKWQGLKWGEDPVSKSRQADIQRELEQCQRWISLSR